MKKPKLLLVITGMIFLVVILGTIFVVFNGQNSGNNAVVTDTYRGIEACFTRNVSCCYFEVNSKQSYGYRAFFIPIVDQFMYRKNITFVRNNTLIKKERNYTTCDVLFDWCTKVSPKYDQFSCRWVQNSTTCECYIKGSEPFTYRLHESGVI